MMPMSLGGGGQSLEDKFYAIKYFIAGQGLSFVVLKATTSELIGPKKKHLNYLVTITHEPNVSIPNLVKYLMHRALHNEWSVAFKSLITIHYLMNYGNEKFIQNMASSTVNNRLFDDLASFIDRTSPQANDMSTFLRRYSRYIRVKIQTYRSLGLDFCKIKPASPQQTLMTPTSISNEIAQSPYKMKNMPLEHLLLTLPILQDQFDALLAFDASVKDLNNGVITSAFSMLYKDFVKLYITYQTAIIRLLDIYFKLTHVKRVQELFEAYKKFLVRMDKVIDFMRVIDSVGMDKSDMPNLTRSPNLPLKALEKHLTQLAAENKSRSAIYQSAVVVELPKLPNDYGTLTRRNSRNAKKASSSSPIATKASLSTSSKLHINLGKSDTLTRGNKRNRANVQLLKDLNEIGETMTNHSALNQRQSTSTPASSTTATSSNTSASSSSSSTDKKKKDSYYYYCDLDPIQRGVNDSEDKQKTNDTTMTSMVECQPPELESSSKYAPLSSFLVAEDLKPVKKIDETAKESSFDLMIIDDDKDVNNNQQTQQPDVENELNGQATVATKIASGATPMDWVQVEL